MILKWIIPFKTPRPSTFYKTRVCFHDRLPSGALGGFSRAGARARIALAIIMFS